MYQIKGKIDTTNASEFEKEIMAAKPTEIDASQLEYISSAGLRVLLAAQKVMNRQGDMKIVNVKPEIMEIFDVTGFVDILNIE